MKTTIETLKQVIIQQNDALNQQGFHGSLSIEPSTHNPRKVSLYRNSMYSSGQYYRIKTRLAPDMSPAQVKLWLDHFSPETSGFDKSLPEFLPFPNGFDQWQLTHFHICRAMDPGRKGSESAHHSTSAMYSLSELAEDLTNQFENLYKGHTWTNDYLPALKAFCESQNL